MTPAFLILSLLVIGGAVAAMTLRNLIHCALSLVVTFVGLAGLYLSLSAQFAGFAQILVYVGAVAILIVFTILLTRGAEPGRRTASTRSAVLGVGIAVLTFGAIALTLVGSGMLRAKVPGAAAAAAPVARIGDRLMVDYVLPLEALGVLLTSAMLGAVILALPEKRRPE